VWDGRRRGREDEEVEGVRSRYQIDNVRHYLEPKPNIQPFITSNS